MTALIITDQALVSMGIAQALNRMAPTLEVTCLSSMTAALALLVTGTTDVSCVVVDLDMRDGTRMREVIALRSVSPTLPLIVLTAQQRPHEVAHASELRCTAYLEKSADLGVLSAALAEALSAQHSMA